MRLATSGSLLESVRAYIVKIEIEVTTQVNSMGHTLHLRPSASETSLPVT